MDTRVPDDDDIEAVLRGEVPAGRSDLVALADAVSLLRREVPAHAPAASRELGVWLAGTPAAPALPVDPPPVRTPWARAGLRWFAGLGLGAQTLLAGAAAAATIGTAGAAGALPDRAQQVFDEVLNRHPAPTRQEPGSGERLSNVPAPVPPRDVIAADTDDDVETSPEGREQDDASADRPDRTVARGDDPEDGPEVESSRSVEEDRDVEEREDRATSGSVDSDDGPEVEDEVEEEGDRDREEEREVEDSEGPDDDEVETDEEPERD